MRQFKRSEIMSAKWGNGADIRYLASSTGALFIAADLCRALNYKTSGSGIPNVTAALLDIRKGQKLLVELEVAPETYAPYTRYVAIDVVMMVHLVARALARDAGEIADGEELRSLLARIAARSPVATS